MIGIPTLPIDPQTLAVAKFYAEFRTVEGFNAVFELKLADLQVLSTRRDVKRAAYLATEQLYQQLYNEPKPRFHDAESFFHARRNFQKRRKTPNSVQSVRAYM